MYDEQKAAAFIYRNARPLDLARYWYHFEQGGAEKVLSILAYYQNTDGGFGHGLEPDFWNPGSTPIATWAAVKILRETQTFDQEHPLTAGVLRYLASGVYFNGGYWFNTVPENDDYPHAVWWRATEDYDRRKSENPTVSLAAFFLRSAAKTHPFYRRAAETLAECVADYLNMGPVTPVESHVLNCFVEAYEDLVAIGGIAGVNLRAFSAKLKKDCLRAVEKDPSRWGVEYVPRPSNFVKDRESLLYADLQQLVSIEAEWIRQQQDKAGIWPITWSWWTDYPQEEAISKRIWQAYLAIDNLLFLRNFNDTVKQ